MKIKNIRYQNQPPLNTTIVKPNTNENLIGVSQRRLDR